MSAIRTSTPEPIVDTAVKSLREVVRITHPHVASMNCELPPPSITGVSPVSRLAPRMLSSCRAPMWSFCAAMCLLEPGDNILVPEPMYVTYEGVVGASGAEIIPIPSNRKTLFIWTLTM